MRVYANIYKETITITAQFLEYAIRNYILFKLIHQRKFFYTMWKNETLGMLISAPNFNEFHNFGLLFNLYVTF